MKKMIYVFAFTAILASCGSQNATEVPFTDTTATAPVDTTAVDTTAVATQTVSDTTASK